jgi:hypothetical protein
MEIAKRLGIDAATCEALEAFGRRLGEEPGLKQTAEALSLALAELPADEAVKQVEAAKLDARLGVEAARTFYLWLLVGQVPAAEKRRAAEGLDAAMTQATLVDLAVWARHFNKQVGTHGVTLEIVGWAQRYLRGGLLRVGAMQFEVIPFEGAVRAFRHRQSGVLSSMTPDGRALNPATGEPGAPISHPPAEWEPILAPGMPVLDMHIPANTFVALGAMIRTVRQAFTVFAAKKPVAAAGEAWLLDPQIKAMLPRNAGLLAIQGAISLYPSTLPEAATIRRLFGPEVSRSDLPRLPIESLNTLQRAVIEHLANPAASLRARGGFIHLPELERLEAGQA